MSQLNLLRDDVTVFDDVNRIEVTLSKTRY